MGNSGKIHCYCDFQMQESGYPFDFINLFYLKKYWASVSEQTVVRAIRSPKQAGYPLGCLTKWEIDPLYPMCNPAGAILWFTASAGNGLGCNIPSI